jgi:hypothetical protein
MAGQPDFAFEYQAEIAGLTTAISQVAADMWSGVDPGSIADSWAAQIPEMTAVTAGAQVAAAKLADPYLEESAVFADAVEDVAEKVAPRAFAGVASDGRALASLLYQPVISSLLTIKHGADTRTALASGRATLDMIARTQVADAGRSAVQVGMTPRKEIDGYVRVTVGATCSRCVILAGKFYRWNSGFDRHPNCDCVHLATKRVKAAGIDQDPEKIYALLSPAERSAAGWSYADQRAIAEGADLNQVTNIRRKGGLYVADGKQYTREGAKTRGRRGITEPRKTPGQIYREAGDDRDKAIALLRENGYLFGKPADLVREELSIAAPAAAVTDPALKLTVAHLKQLAKDNGVPLYGATKKHDIIAVIRQWESDKLRSGGKILLPDGPIGKPISFKKAVIKAPPLGVPAADGPVLSGARLNDWADYFKYDLQNGRHELVDAAGNTRPEGVRVRALRVSPPGIGSYTAAHGTAWRFDGVAYLVEHGPDDFGSPWVSRTLADLRAAHAHIPAASKANLSYTAVTGRNPADAYWRAKFNNPGHVSAMTAGGGHITIWGFRPTSRVSVDLLRHETGHNLDDLIGRHTAGSDSPEWAAAGAADTRIAARVKDLDDYRGLGEVEPGRGYPNGVTQYGRSSPQEDFAESVELYQRGRIANGRLTAKAEIGPVYFRDLYPARAKILDKLFPDIAKAQKAEIKALRVVKPPPATATPPKGGESRRINAIPPKAPARIRERVDNELERQSSLVPAALKSLQRIEVAASEEWGRLVANGVAEEKFWAGYQTNSARIVLSPRWVTDRAELAKRLSRAYDKRELAWSFPDFSLRNLDVAAGIIRHEFGHHVASLWPSHGGSWNAAQRQELLGPLAKHLGVAPPDSGDVASWFGRNEVRNAVIGLISRRAGDGFDEMLAEIWAVYSGRGEDAPAWARDIGGIMRRAWDRQAGGVSTRTGSADLAKLTVPKLMALAKERGLKGYSKLTKPKLLELLGPD